MLIANRSANRFAHQLRNFSHTPDEAMLDGGEEPEGRVRRREGASARGKPHRTSLRTICSPPFLRTDFVSAPGTRLDGAW